MDFNQRHQIFERVASRFGTPCFVYFFDDIVERVRDVRTTFEDRFRISYAVKANPNPDLLQRMRGVVDQLDISSGGELVRGLDAGWSASDMSFTGPGKRPAELELAVRRGVAELVIESLEEARSVDRFAQTWDVVQPVVVRIAPSRIPRGFGINMAGKPSQFGIDEENIDEVWPHLVQLQSLDVCGLHIYSGTQCLNADSIAENYQIFAEIFSGVAERHDFEPRTLILGSGIGIPYHDGNVGVDLTAVAEKSGEVLDGLSRNPRLQEAKLVLETGRYLVGEAGMYLTRVLNVKESRGARIGICDGGMNHHLGACGHLGSVIHRNYPIFKVGARPAEEASEHDLVGPLCTSIDTLGHSVSVPRLASGDLVGIGCSGAYGLTASPMYFISHAPPKEVIIVGGGVDAEMVDVSMFDATTKTNVGDST